MADNKQIKCQYCDKLISKNNFTVHENTIKHQNNVKLKQGINPEVEKLKQIIVMLQNENIKLKFELNSFKN